MVQFSICLLSHIVLTVSLLGNAARKSDERGKKKTPKIPFETSSPPEETLIPNFVSLVKGTQPYVSAARVRT
jgi:hypothetical protein